MSALDELVAARRSAVQPQRTPLQQVVALTAPPGPGPEDQASYLVLAALQDLDSISVLLASDDDDEDDSGPSGKSSGGDDEDSDDDEYNTIVAKLVKKGIPKPRAMAMAKQAMKRVKATMLARDAITALSGLYLPLSVLTAAERKKPSAHTIPGSDDFPIPDKGHLSAAIARYKQGALAGHSKDEVARHIRSRAKSLGVDVSDSMGSE